MTAAAARPLHLRIVTEADVDRDDKPYDPRRRPRVRADCKHVPRPCPFATCRYNLFVHVDRRGDVSTRTAELDAMRPTSSCALDVAEAGGLGLGKVAGILGLTATGVLKLEQRALEKLARSPLLRRWALEHLGLQLASRRAGRTVRS